MRRLLLGLAVLFLVVHVRALPHTLEDIDSINFAMGVESFDVARHQPHPPGYPVYIALAKASTAVIGAVAPSWDRDRRAAAGLAIWSVLAGALAVYLIAEFWLALGFTPVVAGLASLVAVTAPLFWFTAARPLTDTLAVLAALVVQTWILRGWRAARAAGVVLPRDWILAAAGTGLCIGLRSQTLLLTAPLLLWAIGWLVARRRTVHAGWLIGAAASGVLAWAVPLVWESGGIRGYLAALHGQGGEDFASADILVTRASWRMFQATLRHTFTEPWVLPALANVVLVLALIGVVRLSRREKQARLALALAFVPYLLFQLVFQETITIRYSLPLIVPVAGLAVVGLAALGTRVAVVGAAAIAITSLVVVQPRLEAFGGNPSPVFQAFRDMQRSLPAGENLNQSPVLRMHHQIWHVARRPIDWYRPSWDVGPQPFPGDREWLGIVRHWTAGETRPVWLLADTSRNDVKLFDWRATERRSRYEPSDAVRALIRGLRLDALDWWSLGRPRWMLGTGWSLTPEIAGMTSKDGTWPHQRPAEAFLLRDNAPARLMLGARYLSREGAPATVTMALDGQPLGSWPISSSAPWFVQWIDLPTGIPAGLGALGSHPYARLTVTVTSTETGRPAPTVGLEQFDMATASENISAFLDDWNEYEGDPRTGRLWRWTTAASTMLVKGATRDLQLTLEGESPLRYFDRAPTVVVRAGERELARFSPSTDFSQQIPVPLAALAESEGRITIATDLTFVPKERGQGADPRRLGLRLFKIEVR